MRSLNDIIFIDSLPKLDLHGYDSETARVAINDFVNDNYKMKKEFFTIVHGNGSGILRTATHKTLKSNKTVADFKTYYYNTGCTIVQISLDKKGN